MPYPLIELGGRGPPLVLLPANGFPPETYAPALAPLLARYRVVSLPPRALWEDAGPAPEAPGSWATLAGDLLEGMRRHRLAPAVAIGHSFGAVAVLLAALEAAESFRALGLLDPTILPPAVLDELREQRGRGETGARALVKGALTRRDRFASEQHAFDYWRPRPLFADWSDDALWRYVRALLRPMHGGLGLRWPREWEAHYYQSIDTEIWEELERLGPTPPVLLVRGERSDTFVPAAAELLRRKLPWVEQRVIGGFGHLFPQAAPEETGRLLAEWLSGLAL